MRQRRYINMRLVVAGGLALFASALALDTSWRVDAAIERYEHDVHADLQHALRLARPSLARALTDGDSVTAQSLLTLLADGPAIAFASVESSDGTVLLANHAGRTGQRLSPAPRGAHGVRIRLPIEGLSATLVADGDLRSGASAIRAEHWGAMLHGTALSLLVCVVLGFVVTRNFSLTTRGITALLHKLGDVGERTGPTGREPTADTTPDVGEAYRLATDKLSSRLEELANARDALAARGDYLEVTLRSIGDAVIVTDATGAVTAMNAMAEQLTGWLEPDARGVLVDEVFRATAPDTEQPASVPVDDLMRADRGAVVTSEVVLTGRGGREHRVASTAGPIRSTGDVQGVVLVFRDITEEHALQVALEASERRLSAAVEGGQIGIWEWNAETDAFDHEGPLVEHFSDRFEGGVRTGTQLVEVTHPDDRADSREALVSHLKGEADLYGVELRILQHDDSYRHFLIRGRVTERGNAAQALIVVGTYTDVTELRREQKRLELALQFGHQGLYEWWPDSDVLTLSESWYAHFGHAPGSISNMRDDFVSLVNPTDREYARKSIIDALKGVSEYTAEFRIRSGDGRNRWILARGVVDQRDERGRAIRTIGTHLDITELKESQDRLQLALDAGRQGMMEWWPESDRLVPDASWCQLTGYLANDVPTSAALLADHRVHEQDVARLEALMRELADGTRETGGCEFRLRFKSGEYRWLLASGKLAERRADGRAQRVVGTVLDITDLKSAEQQVQLAVEAARQGIWEWLPESDAFTGTRSWARLFGYDPDHFATMTSVLEHVVHPDDAEASSRLLAELRDGLRETCELDLRMRKAGGEYLWVIARAFVSSRGQDGRALRVTGTDFDITELKLAEQSLEMAVKSSRQGMLEWHPADDILLPAPSWLQLTGYAPGDVISLSQVVRQNIVHPDDVGALTQDVRNVLEGRADEISREFRLKLRSGEYLWVLARAFVAERDAAGAPLRLLSTHIDVSELKRAEERLNLAVESGRQGLWEWSPDDDRLEPLSNWLSITGYDSGELPTMAACYARGVIHEDDRKLVVAELEALVYGERDQGEIEFRMRRKAGDYFWALTRIMVAERALDGRATRVIGVNIDITERRATEERLDIAVEASRQGTWEWTLADDAFRPDRHWSELFRAEDRELSTMADVVEHVVHPEDQPYARAIVTGSRTLETDHAQAEFRLRGEDGDYVRVLTRTVVAERDAEQRPLRIVGTTIDISHLKETEARMALAIEGARLGLWEWYPQTGEVRFPGGSWLRLTGLSAASVRHMDDLMARLHPDDHHATKTLARDVVSGRADHTEMTQRLRLDDGREIWLLSRGRVVDRDAAGLPLRVVGTSFDITELKQTQRELESSREFLQVVLDTVPESIFWKDADSRYLGANRHFAEDAGFERPEDVVGLTDYDLAWREFADKLRSEDATLLKGGETSISAERAIRTANQEDMWISTKKVPMLNHDDEPIGVLGVFRDVSAARETLDALQAERDRLELVIDATGVGIWDVEFASERLHLDRRAAEIVGYDPAELADMTTGQWLEHVHPDDRANVSSHVNDVFSDPEGRFDCEYRVRHKLGNWVWMHDTGRVTSRAADGAPERLSGMVFDATERVERDGHLKTIAEAVTRAQGGDLLHRVVQAARELTETQSAYVAALDESGTKVSVIAAWPPDPVLEALEYELEGSPCSDALDEHMCIFPEQVATLFPKDTLLADMGIEAYAGRRLLDESGETRGLFVLLDLKPFDHVERIRFVLDILASTASNELEREQRNHTLRDSEIRYRQTYERMPILLCTLDQNGAVVDANEAWCHATGHEHPQCIGRRVNTFFAAGSDAAVNEILAAKESVVTGSGHHLDLLGTGDDIIATTYTLFGGGRIGATDYRILALEDVTARLRAEEQLRITATAFETHGAIVVADRQRRILRVNQAFTELTQYHQSESVGQTPDLLQSRRHDEHFYREIWYEVEQFGRWEGEMWGRRKDSSEFPVWQAITAVYDTDHELTHYVINMLDITDRVRAEREIERLAFFDSLTGLANRRYLLDRLEVAISTAKRRSTNGALLFIDLDHFKQINDSMGHSIGDAVLIQVAQRLQELTRQEDVVCRLGGDEFVLLLGEVGSESAPSRDHTLAVVQKIRALLSEPYVVERQEFHITPTVGVAMFPEDADTPADILKEADSAMYQGKTEGRNTWRFYDPVMAERATERMELESDLRAAVEAGELELYFQPQVCPGKGIIGAEALLRWNHAERGFVPPDKFIPIAEESTLINDIGRIVIDRALEVASGWLRDGLSFIDHLSINLSSRQFRASDFVEDLETRRARSGVPAQFIVLEVTEHTIIDDIEGAIAKMTELRALGFRFSVDDFGIGYSSLAYLRRLPLDQLKIDRSFVLDVVDDVNAGVIAETIISMGRQLGLETIAEGVENEEQRDFLMARGCEEFQGYLYCRPVPDQAFRAYCGDYGKVVAAAS